MMLPKQDEKPWPSVVSRSSLGPVTRGKETGTCLTIVPTFVNGTELSNHEWRDSFLLRYSLSPLGLPLKCDGCGDEFSINHALKCKYGGLIILRHDEVTRELIELGTMALRLLYEDL
jgi:hypothetical protein